MKMDPPYPDKVSYAEYLTWNDEERYEIIDGIPHLQVAPSRRHQPRMLLSNIIWMIMVCSQHH
ncbi:hypothetical protein CVD25_03485 [Bacillus canaveralius]|uniref:Uncharacterized protein n=1 Tax=Bacillus canaveralius TaxID=1403243 RepID=A0A2N5GSC3_9BACI|nr:hypothetical protein [Bacillus canaveralius]PLR86542.1 hypothetical protein CU635_01080 [Bacillus canaveralius]PLS00313.1 hypothetical protein CVD25_03485 [Bacillus canaveralius]RSK55279.1 hypothetical protein EJA13_04440 [Bacillus canaveralius]